MLCNARRNSLKWVTAAAIGLATTLTLQAGAEAKEVRKKKDDTRTVYLVKQRVNGEVRYNKVGKGKIVKISAAEYRAGNSLVCTPSGFGQRSRCYRPGIF
ncbi:MAG: hypothetical protein ABS35_25030 [Kaistia sp. SCN 65-12]|nr:MAG: hypothetical protein ABS35_25030 [Kaistia sp. SCN 65-12]